MTETQQHASQEAAFADYLLHLANPTDRGPLAALRRGLGKAPAEAPEAYRFIVPWVQDSTSQWEERCLFLVATLFAWYPDQPWRDEQPLNLGGSFHRLAQAGNADAAERRFVALLKSHRDDLPEHLRQAISLLRASQVPIDWAQLLRDVRWWGRDDRRVQRLWARAFWTDRPEIKPNNAA